MNIRAPTVTDNATHGYLISAVLIAPTQVIQNVSIPWINAHFSTNFSQVANTLVGLTDKTHWLNDNKTVTLDIITSDWYQKMRNIFDYKKTFFNINLSKSIAWTPCDQSQLFLH